MQTNPEIKAALQRLLVALERPDEVDEWQGRGDRSGGVLTDAADQPADHPKAA